MKIPDFSGNPILTKNIEINCLPIHSLCMALSSETKLETLEINDLGFGKERKIGTQATEFLSKRKNWTVGNICSKQELIDKIKADDIVI